MSKLVLWTIRLFPVWALAASAVALAAPGWFTPGKPAIVPLLAVIMFGMGMTLTLADFKRVVRDWRAVGVGVLTQYLVMPAAAFVISKLMGLDAAATLGMVLVGAASGGTASNVIAYLAGARVALSISMTLLSTLVAIVAMPWLTWLYVGQMVKVDPWAMLQSIAWIVVLPVAAGVTLNTLFGRRLAVLRPVWPLASTTAIVVIIAIVVALNQPRIATMGLTILIAVILHNTAGLAAGYGLPRLLRFDRQTCRTIAIEVGMQNSGLAVAIANSLFAATPLAALPGAVFSIWHNISGSVLAAIWRSRPAGEQKN